MTLVDVLRLDSGIFDKRRLQLMIDEIEGRTPQAAKDFFYILLQAKIKYMIEENQIDYPTQKIFLELLSKYDHRYEENPV
jgi:hypothetical protein